MTFDMDTVRSDKKSHGYLPTYLKIAEEIGPAARVVELGVWHGESLELWQDLFPDGIIVGVDINPQSTWPVGTHQVIASQDYAGLPLMLREFAPAYDLIVDDASHLGHLTTQSFHLLWPLVAPGGRYVVEDWMVGIGQWPGWDDSMWVAVSQLLQLLTLDSEVESIHYRYGMCIVKKRA